MISPELIKNLELHLQSKIPTIKPVSGGSINHAFRLDTADGRSFFLKTNASPEAGLMFRSEQLGLALLGASRVIAVPKVQVLGKIEPDGEVFLMMEFIEPGLRTRPFWENFGQSLANLHGNASEWFGFSHDNYIGSLAQSNTRHKTWEDFYANERLLPQMILGLDSGVFSEKDSRQLESLCKKIAILCPREEPALTHGDLWSNNFLSRSGDNAPVLIDPAASFAHREMDLAMSRLFGGFDPAFYSAYESAWPLEPGFEGRAEVYQLYYLLVHANLFGGGYVDSVRQVLRRFV